MKTPTQPTGSFHSQFGTLLFTCFAKEGVRLEMKPEHWIEYRGKKFRFTLRLLPNGKEGLQAEFPAIQSHNSTPLQKIPRDLPAKIQEASLKGWERYLKSNMGEQTQKQVTRWWRATMIQALIKERSTAESEIALLQTEIQTINHNIEELI